MGAWGYGLYQNDDAEDMKEIFKEEYEKDREIEKIEEEMKKNFKYMIEDEEEAPIFWCILADLEWKYGVLTEKTKNVALEFLGKGGDIEFWLENESKSDTKKREKVLKKLEEKLKMPQPKKRKIPKKYPPYICNWQRGDAFVYKMDNKYAEGTEYYGKYVVLIMSESYEWLYDSVLPIVYVLNKIYDEVPSLEEIKNEKMLKMSREDNDKYVYKILLAYDSIRERKALEIMYKIGSIGDFKKPEDEFYDERFEINNRRLCFYKKLHELIIHRYNKYSEKRL